MKNKFILVLISLIVFYYVQPLTGQTIYNRKLDKLNGPVSSVIEITEGDTIETAYYDTDGKALKKSQNRILGCRIDNDPPDTQDSWNYFYNKQGLMYSEAHSYSFLLTKGEEENAFIDEMYFTYNTQGLIIRDYKTVGNPKAFDRGGTTLFNYNKTGKKISETKYCYRGSGNDSIMWKKKYNYNKKGLLLECKKYEYELDKSGMYESQIYRYNKSGKLIEVKDKNTKGEISLRQNITYDSIQRKIKLAAYLLNEIWYSYDYRYNPLYFEEEYSSYKNQKIRTKSIKRYDSTGRIIKKTYFNQDLKIETEIEYKYGNDKYGNWIKCTETRNGTLFCFSQRIISYY